MEENVNNAGYKSYFTKKGSTFWNNDNNIPYWITSFDTCKIKSKKVSLTNVVKFFEGKGKNQFCYLTSGKPNQNILPYFLLKKSFNIKCDKKIETVSNQDKKPKNRPLATVSDSTVCFNATIKSDNSKIWNTKNDNFVGEADYRGLDCGVEDSKKTVVASKPKTKTYTQPKSTISSAELDASKREAESERQKRIELERKLVALENKQKQEQQRIDTDTRVPLLEIISIKTKGKRGTITGIARDNIKVAEVTVDGKPVSLSRNGNFKFFTYVPSTGVDLKVQVTDIAGLTASKIVTLKGDASMANSSISFDRLNPLGKRVLNNKDALALIIGVSNYENTKAKALYADNDALVFKDYATEKLGISENRIKMLINNGADEKDILLSVKEWLRRSAKSNKSDIYVFFAGHGLASQDGKNMYLLPHDGSPRLLEKDCHIT